MATRLELLIAPSIWLYFIYEAVRGGLTVPTMTEGVLPSELTMGTKAVMVLFPFISFSIAVPIVWRRKPAHWMRKIMDWMRAFVDWVFGAGASDRIVRRLRFEWLGITFFSVFGMIGAARAIIYDQPEVNLYFSAFVLSGGLGFLVGWIIHLHGERRSNDSV